MATQTGQASAPQRADLPTVTVGSSVVVFDPDREQAHLLNHSAASVWLLCDGRHPVEAIAAELAASFGVALGDLEPDVRRAVGDLTAAGLLAPAEAQDDEADQSTTAARPTTHVDYDSPRDWTHASGVHAALGASFRHESTDTSLGQFLARVLDPLLATDGAEEIEATTSWTYRIWPADDDPERFVVATEHESLTVNAARSDAISTLLWHYNHDAIEHTHHLLLFHSSAVADDGGVLALPAVANSGKSTLATLLVRAGYRYLTDEALAVDPDTLLVHPYPKPIGLDPGSFPLFPDLEPTEDELPPDLFHHKWWLDPRKVSPHGHAAVPAEPLPLQAVVFPTYDAEAEPSIQPVEPAEGVVLLARNTFNLKRWGQRGLDVLARIATSVPLYTMTHNDLGATLRMVGDVIGPPPEPEADATA